MQGSNLTVLVWQCSCIGVFSLSHVLGGKSSAAEIFKIYILFLPSPSLPLATETYAMQEMQ